MEKEIRKSIKKIGKKIGLNKSKIKKLKNRIKLNKFKNKIELNIELNNYKKIKRKLKFNKKSKKTKTEIKENESSFLFLVFSEKRIKEFDFFLKENNSKKTAKELIKLYFGLGLSLALISIGISSILNLNSFYSIAFFVFCFGFPGLMHYFFVLFLFEKNKREKEELIPDVLLQASIFPKGTSMLKIISYLSKAEYGLMSKEFEKAFNEIKKGKTVEQALNEISFRCKSEIISRAMNLLIQGNKCGAEMNKVFKETAEDILETQSIIKERIASMFIQKYTLILAGGIIVPALLGVITGFVNEMNFVGINELGLGMDSTTRNEIISTALIANQIYIIEYALIASFFIANQEANQKKALVYAIILIPLGIACYNLTLIF